MTEANNTTEVTEEQAQKIEEIDALAGSFRTEANGHTYSTIVGAALDLVHTAVVHSNDTQFAISVAAYMENFSAEIRKLVSDNLRANSEAQAAAQDGEAQ